jgi:hypothetical protein
VNSINTSEEYNFAEEDTEVKIRRSSMKEVLTVCPKCFSPTKISTADIFSKEFACTSEKCGWIGSLAIEVQRDDYREFVKKRKETE